MLICLSQKYQASVDGFSAKNFHDYCDGLKHTLTIVKTTRGYIFGGYTDEAWNSHNEYVKDPNAFIFSLINPSHSPQLIKCSEPDYAIYCGLNYGPSFGYSCSLYLSDFSNLNTLSVSDLSKLLTRKISSRLIFPNNIILKATITNIQTLKAIQTRQPLF